MQVIDIEQIADELNIGSYNLYSDDLPPEIRKIFEEEQQKLGLEGKDICLMIPCDQQGRDVTYWTSFSSGILVAKEKAIQYDIHIHPTHMIGNELRKTIRHELHHIWNGDLDRFCFFPNWLGAPLRKLYDSIFDPELKAQMYEIADE